MILDRKISPLVLQGSVQHYDWGKQENCLVNNLAGTEAGAPPYAELWFGAHKNGPALVVNSHPPERLDRLIEQNPKEILGADLAAASLTTLPFLFKILSIARPLSIQAHPDLHMAELLHKSNSKNYPDANHKPEIAIALTPVQLLCGIRPISELYNCLSSVPEFKLLLSEALLSDWSTYGNRADRDLITNLFAELLRVDSDRIKSASDALFQRLSTANCLTESERWILETCKFYPEGDIGLFFFYLLNLLHLEPMQAVFVAANVPHAYLGGELAECMACSDNTVRAGLTSKFRDVDTLLEMLRQLTTENLARQYPLVKTTLDYLGKDISQTKYHSAAQEFSVTVLTGNSDLLEFKSNSKPVLIFLLEGSAIVSCQNSSSSLTTGQAILIPASKSNYSISLRESRIFVIE